MAIGSKSVWLLCEVIKETPIGYLVQSKIFDGEIFQFETQQHRMKDRKDADGVWVKCQSKGQQGNVVGLVLPGPALRLGSQVNVDIQQVSFHPDPS